MEKTPESAVFAEFLGQEFESDEEQAAFERDVARLVAQAKLISALDDVRAAKKVSKTEVARRIGTQRSVVAKLFSGRTTNAGVARVAEIVDALDCYMDIQIKPQPKRNRRPPIEVHAIGVTESRQLASLEK